MNIIHGIPPLQPKNTWVGVDSEIYTKKGDVKHLHRPTTGEFACITICVNDEDVYFIDDVTQVQQALDNINSCVWVIQNAAFDITHFRRWANVPRRKKLFDTMLVERILFNGYYNQFGLQALVRRHLHEHLDKDIRDEFEDTEKTMTDEQITYACKDALYVRKVALEQRKLMTPDDRRVWTEIELPSFWAILEMKGFRIDVEKWKSIAEINLDQKEQLAAVLPFNPNSPKQVTAWMTANGFKKLESSDEDHLQDAIQKWPDCKAAEMARLVLKVRSFGRNASTYGLNFIEEYLEEESPGVYIIRANYKQIGAETGRTSCSNPNMQNIPARNTKVYRECFIARPGHKLVIADFGAQEPRLLAYVSGDKYLIEHFNSGSDVYISLADDLFGIKITKKDPERQHMKAVVLAIGYGMTKYGMSEQLEISTEEADILIKKANKVLIGASQWGDRQEEIWDKVVTPFGRVVWLNPHSGQRGRNARNAPIQGGAADMMKKVLARMYEDWPFPFEWCLVAIVHDECVMDFPEEYTEKGKAFVQKYMEEVSTGMVGGKIRFIAEVYSGDTWAEK